MHGRDTVLISNLPEDFFQRGESAANECFGLGDAWSGDDELGRSPPRLGIGDWDGDWDLDDVQNFCDWVQTHVVVRA